MDGQLDDPDMDDWLSGGDCEQALRTLYHFLDGELTPDRRAVIQRHLDECSPCLEAFDFEAELKIVSPGPAGTRFPRGCAYGSQKSFGRLRRHPKRPGNTYREQESGGPGEALGTVR